MNTPTHTTCTCGNPACQVRIRRKLAPFCRMPTPAVVPELGIHSSYGEAAQHRQPGQVIRSTRVSGGPKRFAVVSSLLVSLYGEAQS